MSIVAHHAYPALAPTVAAQIIAVIMVVVVVARNMMLSVTILLRLRQTLRLATRLRFPYLARDNL